MTASLKGFTGTWNKQRTRSATTRAHLGSFYDLNPAYRLILCTRACREDFDSSWCTYRYGPPPPAPNTGKQKLQHERFNAEQTRSVEAFSTFKALFSVENGGGKMGIHLVYFGSQA